MVREVRCHLPDSPLPFGRLWFSLSRQTSPPIPAPRSLACFAWASAGRVHYGKVTLSPTRHLSSQLSTLVLSRPVGWMGFQGRGLSHAREELCASTATPPVCRIVSTTSRWPPWLHCLQSCRCRPPRATGPARGTPPVRRTSPPAILAPWRCASSITAR